MKLSQNESYIRTQKQMSTNTRKLKLHPALYITTMEYSLVSIRIKNYRNYITHRNQIQNDSDVKYEIKKKLKAP